MTATYQPDEIEEEDVSGDEILKEPAVEIRLRVRSHERQYLLQQLVAYRRREMLRNDSAPREALADPWAHRSNGMRCHTCMWFVEKAGGKLGRCRRHAPTLGGYPATFPADWCGDHKLDEGKVGVET